MSQVIVYFEYITINFVLVTILACEQGSLTFLAPPHQTPSCRIASLFATRACDSKVSLRAGYYNLSKRSQESRNMDDVAFFLSLQLVDVAFN